MTPVLLGLLVTMALAILIVLAVALPHLRQGSTILSSQGEQRVRELRRRTGAGKFPNRDVGADGDPDLLRAGDMAAIPDRVAGPAVRRLDALLVLADRARDAFDRSAGRAGRAAERYDVAGSPLGAGAERAGQRVRQGIVAGLRWLRTRPIRLVADPNAGPTADPNADPTVGATATAPTGIAVVGDQVAVPAPGAPRAPEVGIPVDPVPVGQADRVARWADRVATPADRVIDLREPPLRTVDLRDLPGVHQMRPMPDLPTLPADLPTEPADLAELADLADLAAPDQRLVGEDEAGDAADEDDSVQVGPRHAR